MNKAEEKENHFECECCGRILNSDECYEDNICSKCFWEDHFECKNCGRTLDNDEYHEDDICNECFWEDHFECECCGETYHNDEHGDGSRCVHCIPKTYAYIREDTYTPEKIDFLKTDKDAKKPLYIGIELEVDQGNGDDELSESLYEISGQEKFFWQKQDGSLSNEGIEIVSHPMTVNYHENFQWQKVLDTLKASKYKSHDTPNCGLHLHVCKDFLSHNEQIKLGIFVHTNVNAMNKIARRSDSCYAQYKNVKGKMKDVNKRKQTRYEALNWNNTKTIEFRMFRGTLKHKSLIAAIQFVDSVCHYVKTVNTMDIVKPNAFEKYKAYVQSNKQYKILSAYFQEKGA